MILKSEIRLALLAPLVLLFASCHQAKSPQSEYESVANDPLKARIYTLDNGMKVFMTAYKDAPRIQTYIAVKAGSKNDPADATGLAHYLEHMLFKGTDQYGTKDFVKEEAEINKIQDLYDQYRELRDPVLRKKMYLRIDSISGKASTLAIANEYDKMMANLGSVGTNAYTSFEQTVYVEDIPSNQFEKWATVQAERYRKPVMRLFHTELEAVYEEKNRGLDNDNEKAYEAMFSGLFQKNTYGTQTTIGTIEHLKNPSLRKIRQYYDTWYVPNNMAICLSGDFDPDSLIKIIRKKFSGLKSKPVPKYVPAKEDPITQPIVKEVLGPNAEEVTLGFRFDGANSDQARMITLIAKILSNGKAGLVDLNLNQKQVVLGANAFPEILKDYSVLLLDGQPKQGQSLDQVRDLMLDQLEKIKKGEFPDWLPAAIINNLKLEETKAYEENARRADAFVKAFTAGTPWADYVSQNEKIAAISKQQIIDFARANFRQNYVIVYKRTGEDKNVQKVEKPHITPVEVNRNEQSPFVKNILAAPVPEIQPRFIDFDKDIKKLKTGKGIPLLYRENAENKTFDLYYVIGMGSNQDKRIKLAMDYLNYLGTSNYSPKQIQQEFYKLACSYSVFSSENETRVMLTGLTENFGKALPLFEELLNDAKPDTVALSNLVSDVLKKRQDDMLDKNILLYGGMIDYAKYGEKSPFTNIIPEKELRAMKPEELTGLIKSLCGYEHHVLFYGSLSEAEVLEQLNRSHRIPAQLKPVPADNAFQFRDPKNEVYVVNYDMKQTEIIFLSKSVIFNKEIYPEAALYNEYFGGGMASIVFQDLRESKALAYSVYSGYRMASKKDEYNYNLSYIGTQSDKLPEALSGMTTLLRDMPESQNVFKAAKESILQNLRTERVSRSGILLSYDQSLKLGVDHDLRKDVFERVPKMSIADVEKFQQNFIKDKKYTMLVLGKKENIDMKILEKYGHVNYLNLKDLFGYDKVPGAEKIIN